MKLVKDPLKARIYTLDNGLKVYLTVNKETPRIQTFIAVRVGGKKIQVEEEQLRTQAPGFWDDQKRAALGRTTLQAGDAADLVLLDCDPSALESPEAIRALLAVYLAYRWRNRKAARCYFAYRWRRLYVIKVLEGMIYTL